MAIEQINGCALRCDEHGTGEPVVLVHGSASDFRTWQGQMGQLGPFRVISYSRRHHWPNAPIPEGADYSMQEHVSDLQALLHSLDAAPAHLVGHSYGGFVCLLLALRDPSLVRSLVLAEPPVITLFVSTSPKPLELLRLLGTRPRTAAAIIRFGTRGVVPARKAFIRGDAEAATRIFGNAVFGPGGYDRLSQAQKAQVHDNLSSVRAELLGSGFPAVSRRALTRLEAPVLLVTGERSIPLFHHLSNGLEELLPRVERVQIPAASHKMHEDNAGAFNRAVHSFLARLGLPGGSAL